MSILQSIFLGVLQGVTEFLPVSSSGHLTVAQHLFNLNDIPLLFDVLLHLATLVAVVLFFRAQIADLICVFWRMVCKKPLEGDKPKQTVIWALICGTLVTGVFGVGISAAIEKVPIKAVCVGFIITAVLLILSGRARPNNARGTSTDSLDTANAVAPKGGNAAPQTQSAAHAEAITLKQGFFLGFAQGIGALPGISRSGITISAALFAGLDRKTAGEFSFILSIPAIVGAFILEAKDLTTLTGSVPVVPLIAGCFAAFVSGFAALYALMRIVRSGKLAWFSVYLIPLGVCGLVLL